MTWSEFDWNLVNIVFRMAVFWGNEYSGCHHLIIQDWYGLMIMICYAERTNEIRVSFPKEQKNFDSLDEAYDYIKSGKWNK